MIVDDRYDRYDRWDRCDHWNIRSLWLSQLLKFDFHIVAGSVQIAGHIRLLWSSRSLRSLCYGFHMIAGVVTIAAVAALVVSINFLRSVTIVHDRYDRRDRLWFYPSDRHQCDRGQSLGSLAIACKMETRLKRQTPSVQAQNTLTYWRWPPIYPRRPWKSRKLLFQNPNIDHRNWAKINTSLHCSKFAVVHHVVYSLWVGWCLFKSGTLPLTLQKFIKIVYFSNF